MGNNPPAPTFVLLGTFPRGAVQGMLSSPAPLTTQSHPARGGYGDTAAFCAHTQSLQTSQGQRPRPADGKGAQQHAEQSSWGLRTWVKPAAHSRRATPIEKTQKSHQDRASARAKQPKTLPEKTLISLPGTMEQPRCGSRAENINTSPWGSGTAPTPNGPRALVQSRVLQIEHNRGT